MSNRVSKTNLESKAKKQSANTVNRHFCSIRLNEQELNIHYRTVGNNTDPMVFLLHPSPLSSAFMLPIMQVFAQAGYYAIAWDAPGYGDSDKLSTGGETLKEYCDSLAEFIQCFITDDSNTAKIYGNATGAQIAIEFSKQYPELCHQLILENAAIFTDDERDEFMQHYFPDLSPKQDGSHLTTTWQIVNQLFQYFPWYDTSEKAKLLTAKPPLSVLQATFADYLKAGEGYGNAYKAALYNEIPAQIQSVTCNSDIVLWNDSMLKKYSARLLDVALPKNIKLHLVESGIEQRFATLTDLIKK
ncbi:alpha/beta hydrolase [Psychrosphaera sp. F3M07]|uniref:alpha/beta hydrolase n=1 Tax=Psychrosphaera sp. F3M07 TaxID=2841560 RepID=UPI001C07F450|nr:alpha/beta hydrolase [Psychrosphaera sp. F3M07]MBU2919608.1 alpha/beta hydrolase [Psychrosphaera sp. F3M07]